MSVIGSINSLLSKSARLDSRTMLNWASGWRAMAVAKADPTAAVGDASVALVRTDAPAEAIPDVFETRQCGGERLLQCRLAHQLFGIQGLVPPIHVLQAGVDASGTHHEVHAVVVVELEAALGGRIAEGTVGNHLGRVVPGDRAGHPQRLEDLRCDEIGEGLTGYALHNEGQDLVSGVAVLVPISGWKYRLSPARIGRRTILVVRRAVGHVLVQCRVVVGQPTGVVHQVPHRDLVAITFRDLRNVLADRIVIIEQSALGQDHHRHADELFGDRSQPYPGIGCQQNLPFDVCVAVAGLVDDLTIPDHHYRHAGLSPVREAAEQSVDLLRSIGIRICARRACDTARCQDGQHGDGKDAAKDPPRQRRARYRRRSSIDS